ncbi:carbohydrate-binding module family 52 protein [Aulographum hederae CBS 113979]|uniref:Carbohydrate-binding module family 52 protein n=1 Tax=Aulographum hederae CBS 113979 TaxID=1176131 RepID=A0A6G1HDX3_9PEZI|nr:carbohydrate-binding module family 52 protein [Aulographum hederae CBS 113979]
MLAKLPTLIAFALSSFASAQDLLTCGSQQYYPSAYNCYDGLLCPITNGLASRKCGSACYFETEYACYDNSLAPCLKENAECYRNGQFLGSCCLGQICAANRCRTPPQNFAE